MATTLSNPILSMNSKMWGWEIKKSYSCPDPLSNPPKWSMTRHYPPSPITKKNVSVKNLRCPTHKMSDKANVQTHPREVAIYTKFEVNT